MTGEERMRMIENGNMVARRCWSMYKLTLDERHADLAEWWREKVEAALNARG